MGCCTARPAHPPAPGTPGAASSRPLVTAQSSRTAGTPASTSSGAAAARYPEPVTVWILGDTLTALSSDDGERLEEAQNRWESWTERPANLNIFLNVLGIPKTLSIMFDFIASPKSDGYVKAMVIGFIQANLATLGPQILNSNLSQLLDVFCATEQLEDARAAAGGLVIEIARSDTAEATYMLDQANVMLKLVSVLGVMLQPARIRAAAARMIRHFVKIRPALAPGLLRSPTSFSLIMRLMAEKEDRFMAAYEGLQLMRQLIELSPEVEELLTTLVDQLVYPVTDVIRSAMKRSGPLLMDSPVAFKIIEAVKLLGSLVRVSNGRAALVKTGTMLLLLQVLKSKGIHADEARKATIPILDAVMKDVDIHDEVWDAYLKELTQSTLGELGTIAGIARMASTRDGRYKVLGTDSLDHLVAALINPDEKLNCARRLISRVLWACAQQPRPMDQTAPPLPDTVLEMPVVLACAASSGVICEEASAVSMIDDDRQTVDIHPLIGNEVAYQELLRHDMIKVDSPLFLEDDVVIFCALCVVAEALVMFMAAQARADAIAEAMVEITNNAGKPGSAVTSSGALQKIATEVNTWLDFWEQVYALPEEEEAAARMFLKAGIRVLQFRLDCREATASKLREDIEEDATRSRPGGAMGGTTGPNALSSLRSMSGVSTASSRSSLISLMQSQSLAEASSSLAMGMGWTDKQVKRLPVLACSKIPEVVALAAFGIRDATELSTKKVAYKALLVAHGGRAAMVQGYDNVKAAPSVQLVLPQPLSQELDGATGSDGAADDMSVAGVADGGGAVETKQGEPVIRTPLAVVRQAAADEPSDWPVRSVNKAILLLGLPETKSNVEPEPEAGGGKKKKGKKAEMVEQANPLTAANAPVPVAVRLKVRTSKSGVVRQANPFVVVSQSLAADAGITSPRDGVAAYEA